MAANLALAVVLDASDRHLRRASSAVSRGIFVKYLSLSLFLLICFCVRAPWSWLAAGMRLQDTEHWTLSNGDENVLLPSF